MLASKDIITSINIKWWSKYQTYGVVNLNQGSLVQETWWTMKDLLWKKLDEVWNQWYVYFGLSVWLKS